MANIEFISAENGGVEFYDGNHGLIGFAKTAQMVAYIIQTHGMEEAWMSSSMDFANEYGFATAGGAKELLNEGIELYNAADHANCKLNAEELV